jgi:hypothetical protein
MKNHRWINSFHIPIQSLDFILCAKTTEKLNLIRILLFSIGHAAIHTSGFTPLIKYGYIYYLGMVEF